MANTKVELNYYYREEESFAWQHRKLGDRVEIKEEEIAEIAKRFRVAMNVSIKERNPVSCYRGYRRGALGSSYLKVTRLS